MKTLFISLVAATLSLTSVNAKDSTVISKTGNLSNTENTASTVSYNRLLEENKLLKEKIDAVINESEELKSTLDYQNTMGGLVNKLNEEKQAEKLEEMKAEIAYQKMMANLILRLKQVGI